MTVTILQSGVIENRQLGAGPSWNLVPDAISDISATGGVVCPRPPWPSRPAARRQAKQQDDRSSDATTGPNLIRSPDARSRRPAIIISAAADSEFSLCAPFRPHLCARRPRCVFWPCSSPFSAAPAAPCEAAKRVALVVGNDAYQYVPELRKAVTDANAIASALRSIGFTRVGRGEPGPAGDEPGAARVRPLGRERRRGVLLLRRARLRDLRPQFPAADRCTGRHRRRGGAGQGCRPLRSTGSSTGCRRAGAQTAIMVLDACRNNPFARPGTRALPGGGGLTPLMPPEGTFVLFSAGAKQTALDALDDNDPDPNSVFTRHFVRQLATPGHDPGAAREAHAGRGQAGRGAGASTQQTPAYYDEIIGDFVLNDEAGRAARRGADRGLNVPSPASIAPRPEPPPPPPAPSQPVNAPLASFMRNNSGWSVSLSFVEPVTAISWRLGETGTFQGNRLPRYARSAHPAAPAPTRQLRARQGRTEATVSNPGGRSQRPHDRTVSDHLRPDGRADRDDRRMLEMTVGQLAVVSRIQRAAAVLHASGVVSLRHPRGADRHRQRGAEPGRCAAACDPAHPYEIPDKLLPWLKVPPGTKMASIELTYRDGSVSETKTFRR